MAVTKSARASIESDDNGGFDMILSNSTRDRDGDVLRPEQWVQPLPATIPINLDHSPHVADIIGSGTPFLDPEGNLRVRGTFASTPQAQHARTLINEGHLRSVSVEFLQHRGGRNELVGGAVVSVPSNPTARIIESKSLDDEFERRWGEVVKAVGGGDAAMIQAVHDASVHLGAACPACTEPHAADVPDTAASPARSAASAAANTAKAAALRLRLKAIQR